MKHKKYLFLINLYLDKELDSKREYLLKEHLKVCKFCREYLEEIKKEKLLLNNLEFPSVSQDFETKLFKALFQKTKESLYGLEFKIILGVLWSLVFLLFLKISLFLSFFKIDPLFLIDNLDFLEFLLTGGEL